jgi:methylthioribose-1-phosphate isomerase
LTPEPWNQEPIQSHFMLPTIAREDDAVVMIDQRKLPAHEVYVRCKTAAEVARAIKTSAI